MLPFESSGLFNCGSELGQECTAFLLRLGEKLAEL
jgi:hypothetical protein